jgi:hypothetical protein
MNELFCFALNRTSESILPVAVAKLESQLIEKTNGFKITSGNELIEIRP